MKHAALCTLMAIVLAAAASLGTIAFAQDEGYGSGRGMGPGMMEGYGPGYRGGSPGQGYGEPQHPDLNSPGGQAFAFNCSQCHGLPSPSQHTPDQWPAVVARMEQYMRNARMPPPGNEETKAIDHFLQQHATPGE